MPGRKIRTIGLGYLTLDRPMMTLSGGECQRLKLSNELHKTGSVYALDEPTTGLHMTEVAQLLSVLNRLVEAGTSVIVSEQNLDAVKNADRVIELGPEGGAGGGKVVFEGTAQQLLEARDSYIAGYLRTCVA